VSKETHSHFLFAIVNLSSTPTFEKETKILSKETYSQKRLAMCQKRPTVILLCNSQFEQHADLLKRYQKYVKRDLCPKETNNVSKETHSHFSFRNSQFKQHAGVSPPSIFGSALPFLIFKKNAFSIGALLSIVLNIFDFFSFPLSQ